MSTLLAARSLDRIPPAAMAILSIAILCAMDGVLKDWTTRYSSLQVTLMRFAASASFGLVFFFAMRAPQPGRRSVLGNVKRGVLFLLASALFIHAVAKAPLAQVFAVSYIAPVLAALLAMAILGERPDRRIALSLAIGFAGVLVAIGGVDMSGARLDHLEGAAAALASAVCYAFVLIYLRRQALSDPPITIALFQSLTPALILGALCAGSKLAAPQSAFAALWTPVAASDLLGLLFVGLCSIVGHMGMAHAFARAEASRLAPFEYTSFVWATIIGFVWFAEIPSLATIAGAAMIVGACLLLRR